jgi:hypothetical protein
MVLFSLYTHKHFHLGHSSAKQPRPSISFPRYSTLAKLRSIGSPFDWEQHNIVPNVLEDRLHYSRQCMQKVCEVAGALGQDEDDGVKCAVLSRDAVSKSLFDTLLPKMRSLQAQGGTGGAVCNAWMLTLGVFLTSKEREIYGIASAASRDQ